MKYCIAYPYLGESREVIRTATDAMVEKIFDRSLSYFKINKT